MVERRSGGTSTSTRSGTSTGTAAWCDRLLDAGVVLLATWTLVYHVCLVLRIGTTTAVVLEVAALLAAAAAVVTVRRRQPVLALEETHEQRSAERVAAPATSGRLRVLGALTVAFAVVGAVATGLDAPWVLTWLPWLAAALSGTLWAGLTLLRAGSPEVHDGSDQPSGRWTTLGVLAWAVGLGVYSLWTLRPNPDDLFYVNLSQWVASHGQFPVKDTLFSELAYPMANWPPIASYDGLVGVVARLLGAHAASVEYAVPPIATFLAVLALWRLLRAWRVHHLLWVLSTALAFLLFDGTVSYASPGNLFLTRLWQGKIVLLCVVVPLLLVYALRYVERPTRARLVWLALGGIAAVGLTTTSMFLVPTLAVAAMAPLFLRDRRRALVGFLALGGYAVAAALVTVALGGRSADDFGTRRLYRFDASWIGHQVLLTDLVGFVAVLALLLGALLVPHPSARLTSGLVVLFTGCVLVPGAMRAAYDVTGLGPTLWRISWAASVAALVGVLAVHGVGPLLEHLAGRVGRDSWRRWSVPVAGVVTIGLLAAFGAPIWSPATSTELRPPFHWQRSYSTRHVTSEILSATRPGDIVLAPEALSITIAVTTTDVKTVAPRDYYMHYLRHDPTFHYPERLTLVHYVNGLLPGNQAGIAHDLDLVGVDVACTTSVDKRRYRVIRAAGFRPLLTTTYYRCLTRT
ncbi:MAG TPA: DUF6077 domain-containing protein [Nocardioides sp.]|jgi:hypothetical protein|nr:DUF6077 domain-containing protein [Nocardioides sp.]